MSINKVFKGSRLLLAAASIFALSTAIALPSAEAASLNPGFSYNFTTKVLTDTNSGGLNWLNLNETRGRSYNDISSKFGAGEEFDGWRYANDIEFLSLISNWVGAPVHSDAQHNEDVIDDLISFIGDTSGAYTHEVYPFLRSENADGTYGTPNDFHATLGILAPHNPGVLYTAYVIDHNEDTNALDFNEFTEHHTLPIDMVIPDHGSYLVQDISPVPLPPAALMFAPALLGVGAIARRRKKQLQQA